MVVGFDRVNFTNFDLVTPRARVFQRKIICNKGVARSKAFLRGTPDATYLTCRFAANFTLFPSVPFTAHSAVPLPLVVMYFLARYNLCTTKGRLYIHSFQPCLCVWSDKKNLSAKGEVKKTILFCKVLFIGCVRIATEKRTTASWNFRLAFPCRSVLPCRYRR